MKKVLSILSIFLIFFSCAKKPSAYSDIFSQQQAPLHYSVFQDITNLMTPSPDSAFQLISAFTDTLNQADLTAPDRHEYNILLAEALYKNYYLQSNDSAVNEAVQFYDSLVRLYPKNLDLQFQKARAYYYKGVGDNEKDDIVATCKDYLTALEVMEKEFDGIEIDENKTKFFALININLGKLFFQEKSIEAASMAFTKALLSYESIYDTISVIYTLFYLAENDVLNKDYDQALSYYNKINNYINDSCVEEKNSLSGDIAIAIYNKTKNDSIIIILKEIINKTENEDEIMRFQFSLAEIYNDKNEYDSAKYYYQRSMYRNRFTLKKAAKNLSIMYGNEGKTDSAVYYGNIYSDNASRNEIKEGDKQKITGLYNEYEYQKENHNHNLAKKRTILIMLCVFVICAFAFSIYSIISKKKRQKKLEQHKRVLDKKDKQLKEMTRKLSSSPKPSAEVNLKFTDRWQKFVDSDIYKNIKDRLPKGDMQIKEIPDYSKSALSENDKIVLVKTINQCFDDFTSILSGTFGLNSKSIRVCCFIFMKLSKVEIAVLSGVSYNAVNQQYNRIQKSLGINERIDVFLDRFFEKIYQ